ncbi:importin-4-like [Lucilia cuprina]|uniref:importin-4-like n=1 Tax=Lucilia cuprina TaxID=7375 RepID=UPI000C7193F4|nr:importin-4-like [Lucilia cuprina]KAI8126152.1 Importin-4 [Lucilia cuprina]
MEQIIANLLCADNNLIKQATADLQEAYKRPETIPQLCDIVVSNKEPQVRQYSAVLLKKRLGKLRHWQMVPPEQQQIIKQGMLNALVNEQEKSVRNAIAQFVGVLVRHEADKKDPWMNDVLKFIYSHCSSSDPKQSELGSSIFATLTDVAPDQFVPHMESVCEMFTAALVATEASGNMSSPVIFNILSGMTYLVPFILGHNAAEQTYQKSIPLIIKSLQAFAVQPDVDQFVRAFDILESMADYTPKLLTTNIKLLLDFCLEASNNAQLDSAVRVKTVAYIGWLVRLKKKVIIKQKLIEPIIQVVFTLMATEPEGDEDDEEYFLGEDSSNPMTTATQTMDLLALNVPPEKLIPPLLQLLEPALQGQDPLPRRAAYLSMAVIAEGCSEAICNKYLETMLNIVKVGITDPVPLVRNAAFFALGQFSEHLQPDITKFAPQILPILFEFLQQLCNELRSGGVEPKHIDRMFYALETFCENLEDALVPHLPLLMERLFEAMNPNNSVRVRELSLSAISAAANAAKENMMPYFQQLIAMLQTYLVKTENEDILSLRSQAIDTLAAIARTIGKQNFMPLATDTMTFALALLEEADDPDVRRALYNLIASLAEVVNEEMASVFPKIMERLYDSILSTDEVIPEFKEDVINVPAPDNEENEDREIDIENSDGEDDDLDNIAGYSVENSYLDEKEEAILALKEFAQHTGAAFIPYLEQSYKNVYKMIDHPQEDIRKVSIDALTTFIIALYKQNDVQGVGNAITILIPKLGQIVRDDEEVSVVLAALESFSDILKELKQVALPDDKLTDTIFTCINDVLLGKVACQFDEPAGGNDDDAEESEYDEAIVEGAGNLLPLFGHAMQPEKFAMYFGRAYPIIVSKLQKAKKNEELESQRAFVYGALAECFGALKSCTGTYFDTFCPLMIDGLSDDFYQARQNAVFGLGELVLYAEEKSFEAYPHILMALSQAVANEKEPAALDNICGAIARLIITNCNLVPLNQVLPVLLQHLPLREDFDENASIFKCFKLLYIQCREAITPSIEQILAIAIHVLYKKEFVDQETCENAVGLVKEIRENYPDNFSVVANSNPEVLQFLQTL